MVKLSKSKQAEDPKKSINNQGLGEGEDDDLDAVLGKELRLHKLRNN